MIPNEDIARDADVTALIGLLSSSTGWMPAKEICGLLEWKTPDGEANTRKLRDACQGEPAILSGDQGYILLARATPEEFKAAVARQFAKVRTMANSMRIKVDAYHALHPNGSLADTMQQLEIPGLELIYAAGGAPAPDVEYKINPKVLEAARTAGDDGSGFANFDLAERENESGEPDGGEA